MASEGGARPGSPATEPQDHPWCNQEIARLRQLLDQAFQRNEDKSVLLAKEQTQSNVLAMQLHDERQLVTTHLKTTYTLLKTEVDLTNKHYQEKHDLIVKRLQREHELLVDELKTAHATTTSALRNEIASRKRRVPAEDLKASYQKYGEYKEYQGGGGGVGDGR